jgi:RNA ligase (TIGR02306 family)
MRKLASIKRIQEIKLIEGADLICAYRVDGWWIVDQKEKYSVGDLVVYCEIDSFLPHTLVPFLSRGKEPREFEGVKGERLRTIRLKGQISQGLLLPVSILNIVADECRSFVPPDYWENAAGIRVAHEEDADVTELLGILKYERPLPAQLAGQAKGNFPSFIPKTDEERCISAETQIQTEIGNITIKEIVDGKLNIKVASYNHETNQLEYKNIINWSLMSRKNNWLKLTTKSGQTIICTKNHKIWCEDILAYRNSSELTIGQKIIIKTEV